MKSGFIRHKHKLKADNKIMNISKMPVKKVNSERWACRLKVMHHWYPEKIKFQDFHGPMNRCFRDTSFVGQLKKQQTLTTDWSYEQICNDSWKWIAHLYYSGSLSV